VCSLSVHRKGQQEVEVRIRQLSALDEETDNWLASNDSFGTARVGAYIQRIGQYLHKNARNYHTVTYNLLEWGIKQRLQAAS